MTPLARTSHASPTRNSMSLLYVTEDVPNRDPLHGNGSSMISYEVLRHLPSDVAVSLVTFQGEADLPDEIRARCDTVVLLQCRGPRQASFVSALSPLSIGAAARATREARRAISRLSQAADATLLHGPHVAPLASHVRGPIVIQVVDPWSMRVDMEVELARRLRARYRRRKAKQAFALELRFPREAQLLTVGRADAEAWSARLQRPVRSIANGVDPIQTRWTPPPVPTVSFVGSLSYPPNIESATVLAREIGPRIWRQVPQAKFVIAGRQPAPEVWSLASDRVEIRPNVREVQEIYASSSVAVFADRHGLGVRNSVREALGCGLPVVASRFAAREQPPHPLLHVAQDEDQLVALTLDALGHSASPPASPDTASSITASRTWTEVAQEYIALCRDVAER
jgi:glycosyltransferase involved in cell wall biosynthesis